MYFLLRLLLRAIQTCQFSVFSQNHPTFHFPFSFFSFLPTLGLEIRAVHRVQHSLLVYCYSISHICEHEVVVGKICDCFHSSLSNTCLWETLHTRSPPSPSKLSSVVVPNRAQDARRECRGQKIKRF